ncbi:MAG TPA: PIN domain-containing protein [Candidatus Nanoarchaeia archaeon]|nr:PIN domain-containing protein [Candidatus Nanoarchaeia archaeon]
MKSVVLDTSFILTCTRQKIDFFEKIEFLGMKILVPLQVVKELEGVINSKQKLRFREEAKLALDVLEKEKNNFRKIDLKTKNADLGIIKYSKSHPEIIVATLDREIKRRAHVKKMFIRGKKQLDIL